MQCWLTKNDTVQHKEMYILRIEVVILAAERFNIISKQTECVADVTSNRAVRHLNLLNLSYVTHWIKNLTFPARDKNSPHCDTAFLFSKLHDHTQTHHNRYNSSGQVISWTYKYTTINDTDIHTSGGIRTSKHSKRATAEPRLRPHGHLNWQTLIQRI